MTERFLKPDEERIAEALEFIHGFSSVVLGSVTKSCQPHTSYAPHIADAGKFYIYVSSLAQHADTLKNGSVSLFFIEDEQQANTIFARKRLTIHCEASTIKRNHPQHEHLLDLLQERHGSTLKILRSLPDFTLYELKPERASFVTGFGAAYNLNSILTSLASNMT
jgi:putative heme iron utilization protein